jgi:tRNA U34 5-carboxymethylaminomethyl modifying enzyme MnmG/GidA
MEWIGEGLGFVAAVYDRRVAPGFGPSTEVAAGLPRQASNGDVKSPLLSREEARRIETDFKYEGYLQQQERQMERMKRAESRRIPDWFDYRKVSGLSREVTEKLTRVRPLTLGQASRIPGITPAAVSLVNCYIEIFQRRAAEQASV